MRAPLGLTTRHAPSLSSRLLAVGIVTIAAYAGAGATVASASPPTGTCTSSFTPYTLADFGSNPDAPAFFALMDTNDDGIICFKAYPNGTHNGDTGNFVDDKAAPHS